MTRKKSDAMDAALQGIEGIMNTAGTGLMTYDGGKIVPRVWYENSGGTTSDLPDLSGEEAYEEILSIGLPRMPELEATLDMDKIDPKLLADAPAN